MKHIPTMRRMLWLTLLTAIFSTASATEQDHECQGGHNCNDGGDTISGSESDSRADSSSESEATSSSGADANVSNTTNFTSTRPSKTTVRNVPSPDTPNVYPSAPCRIARSAGLSLAGGAISGGNSVEDVECTLRETARAFQYLGVPEVGLVILCQNSVVINGRRDKKGDLEENERPLGVQECLRLVREFQGDDVEPNTDGAIATEVEILREQQNRVEFEVLSRVEQLEELVARRPAARAPTPVVQQEVVQQPRMSIQQKADMAALFSDDKETSE